MYFDYTRVGICECGPAFVVDGARGLVGPGVEGHGLALTGVGERRRRKWLRVTAGELAHHHVVHLEIFWQASTGDEFLAATFLFILFDI